MKLEKEKQKKTNLSYSTKFMTHRQRSNERTLDINDRGVIYIR